MDQERIYKNDEIPDEELAQEIQPGDFSEDLHTDPDAPESDAPDILEGPPLPWRVAKSLARLRLQVNQLATARSKASDGSIGDPSHQSRKSDHNPHIRENGVGVVSAVDITHDPGRGCDASMIATSLVESRDPRLKYIIWNRRIVASYAVGGHAAWQWRPYSGSNPHNHHVHISVSPERRLYDAERDWTVRVT